MVEFESSPTIHGPFSPRASATEDAPGPPLNQIASGAFEGSTRDSKNQKNVLMGYSWDIVGSSGRCTYPLKERTPGVVSQMKVLARVSDDCTES